MLFPDIPSGDPQYRLTSAQIASMQRSGSLHRAGSFSLPQSYAHKDDNDNVGDMDASAANFAEDQPPAQAGNTPGSEGIPDMSKKGNYVVNQDRHRIKPVGSER